MNLIPKVFVATIRLVQSQTIADNHKALFGLSDLVKPVYSRFINVRCALVGCIASHTKVV